jgi:hypothetical protein
MECAPVRCAEDEKMSNYWEGFCEFVGLDYAYTNTEIAIGIGDLPRPAILRMSVNQYLDTLGVCE